MNGGGEAAVWAVPAGCESPGLRTSGSHASGYAFTCFTGTKVQILTLQASRSSFESARATLLLENAVAGMHQATKRMAGGAKEVSEFVLLYQ